MKSNRLLALLLLPIGVVVFGYFAVCFIAHSTSRKVDAFFFEEHSGPLQGLPRADIDARFGDWKPRTISVDSLDEGTRAYMKSRGFSECVEYRKNFVTFHVVYDRQQRVLLFDPTYE